ncbi:haloacid dehalogenase type II [Alteromonas ponticola]|uniref:(S)-2-haloacid dehalogenase n=1 Tax=Alteromonas aquimaris TaxID=2998417 RepID=A0ABT3P364_9ALTE|nr:haloacid dehalogenase type II [Alteromonas aquimaris]MCW8107200.1 haloacid dehalogenase type II [Alteromonas aquimaris]
MKPSALIFDVNETLLDLSHAKPAIAKLFNDEEVMVQLWFSTLLHHSLVESAIGEKHNFTQIGAAAAKIVAHTQGLSLSLDHAKSVISDAMTTLPAYEDAEKALRSLSQARVKLVALSNSPTEGLCEQLEYAGLAKYFDEILSVEKIGLFKPHPPVYQWTCQKIGVAVEECMMVAAHGWDVAGAASAGLQTAFVAREGKCQYPLAAESTLRVNSLEELVEAIG